MKMIVTFLVSMRWILSGITYIWTVCIGWSAGSALAGKILGAAIAIAIPVLPTLLYAWWGAFDSSGNVHLSAFTVFVLINAAYFLIWPFIAVLVPSKN